MSDTLKQPTRTIVNTIMCGRQLHNNTLRPILILCDRFNTNFLLVVLETIDVGASAGRRTENANAWAKYGTTAASRIVVERKRPLDPRSGHPQRDY